MAGRNSIHRMPRKAPALLDRMTFLPLGKFDDGSINLAMPGAFQAVADAFTAPGRALSGELPVFDAQGNVTQQAVDEGMNVAGSLTLGSALGVAPVDALTAGGARRIKAYHGSPHDFDKFDMSKIGTGEGAQAYGHGLYFADNEAVAKSYRDMLSKVSPNDARGNAWDIVNRMGGDADYAAEILRESIPTAISPKTEQFLKDTLQHIEDRSYATYTPGTGHMYEVQINADPDEFLDWDAPLSAQPGVLRRLGFSDMPEDAIHDEALRIVEAQPGGAWMDDPVAKARIDELNDLLDRKPPNLTGQEYYRGGADGDVANILSQMGYGNPTDQTQRLREAGIPGIKYLDQGSRGAGDGSRNYVVFDDSLIEILRKYGIGALGLGAALGQTEDGI